MSLELQIQIAKAKVAARKKREQLQAEEAKKTKELEKAMLIEEVLKSIEAPKNGENGRDGRDAPEMSEILEQIKPMLPAPVIHKTEERVSREELEAIMSTLFEEKLPEMQKELRPKVELIREELSPDAIDDYITKEDLDDALRRVQDAIAQSSGGGGGIRMEDLDKRLEELEVGATYDKLIDEDGSFVYVGEANPGTDSSAPSWRIKRIDQTNDPDVDIRWANGGSDFDKVWDDRAGYTY